MTEEESRDDEPASRPSNWRPTRQLTVGVCAMAKKTRAAPMLRILHFLARSSCAQFRIEVFDERIVAEAPVEQWPLCDALIAFYSDRFPLDKAIAYVELRRPYCVNSVTDQRLLFNRKRVYDVLMEHGVPVPRHLLLDHQTIDASAVRETDDYVEYGGVRVGKPFVEKPLDAEDHDVYIYYGRPSYGCRKLFRKTKHRSSVFDGSARRIRRQGAFLYEEYIPSDQLCDIKVYAVGPTFAYAERRKSPVVDGVVERNAAGKEVRCRIELTPAERQAASIIPCAFKQFVCGFDLIRFESGDRFVVHDVNGFSFVKGSDEYARECGRILAEHLAAQVPPPAATASDAATHTDLPPRPLVSSTLFSASAAGGASGSDSS